MNTPQMLDKTNVFGVFFYINIFINNIKSVVICIVHLETKYYL